MRKTKLVALLFSTLCCFELSAEPRPDTVIVNGVEWAQPSAFRNLSWYDVNNVCNAASGGACSGTLNGFDMGGFTWASIDDVNDLFNGLLTAASVPPSDLLVGPDEYSEFGSSWATYFFDVLGFDPTSEKSEPEYVFHRLAFAYTRSLTDSTTMPDRRPGDAILGEIIDRLEIDANDRVTTLWSTYLDDERGKTGFWMYRKVPAQVAPSLLTISPPTGTYYSTQDFHFVLHVNYDMNLFTSASIMYNGTEVAGDLESCWKAGTVASGGSSYRCPVKGSDLGEGDNELDVELNFSDGTVLSDSVVWTIEHVYE